VPVSAMGYGCLPQPSWIQQTFPVATVSQIQFSVYKCSGNANASLSGTLLNSTALQFTIPATILQPNQSYAFDIQPGSICSVIQSQFCALSQRIVFTVPPSTCLYCFVCFAFPLSVYFLRFV
jgi:hypothetical protein